MVVSNKVQNKIDACGILCVIFVYLALLYSNYAFLIYVLFYTQNFNIIKCLIALLYELIIVFIFWTHTKTMGDPGVWRPLHNLDFSSTDHLLGDKSDSENWSVCPKCETYRPPKAHHCSVCRVCITKLDHHCPWVNNCIGEKNQKFFLQFLFYVGILCAVTLVSIFFEFLDVTGQNTNHTRALHCIILLIESLLFGIFVIAVFTDQLYVLKNDESTIDRYKNVRRKRAQPKRNKNTFRDLCGAQFYLWLLPLTPRLYQKLDNFIV